MIFVTVGMHHQGFDRLIKAMDELAGIAEEPVVMQIGSAKYEPVHAEWFRFAPQKQVDELCGAARVIVGHAGAGTILSAFHHNRPVVIVPRRFPYQEHVDDHQLDLAHALSSQNKVILVDEPTAQALQEGIRRAEQLPQVHTSAGNLVRAIRNTLESSTSLR